jgi:hypothetical protein
MILLGMMALNGHEISGDVYAWAAVFILPVNSALNPILYTLSAIVVRKVSVCHRHLVIYFVDTLFYASFIMIN